MRIYMKLKTLHKFYILKNMNLTILFYDIGVKRRGEEYEKK